MYYYEYMKQMHITNQASDLEICTCCMPVTILCNKFILIGIAILARWALQPHLGNGEYRVFLITARGLRRKWFAVVRNNAPAYLTAFLQVLRNESVNAIHRPG